jgi:hypothetical protein
LKLESSKCKSFERDVVEKKKPRRSKRSKQRPKKPKMRLLKLSPKRPSPGSASTVLRMKLLTMK